PSKNIQARCTTLCPSADLYPAPGAPFYFGPSMRALRDTWLGEGEALGTLELVHDIALEAESYMLHPALLDGMLRAWYSAADGQVPLNGVHVPARIEHIAVYRVPSPREEMWAHAIFTPGMPSAELCFDLTMRDGSDRILMEVR